MDSLFDAFKTDLKFFLGAVIRMIPPGSYEKCLAEMSVSGFEKKIDAFRDALKKHLRDTDSCRDS